MADDSNQNGHVNPNGGHLPSDVRPDRSATEPSFVVGIGASAGGLDALTTFFREIPESSCSAYVVVQHLSPDHESHMKELLARETPLAIHKVTQGMTIEAGAIYLIPPGKVLRLQGDQLLLDERAPSPSVPHPIDIFFDSLAKERGDQSIAIVLSGTGSDGTRGSVEVSKSGGRVLVQAPESAGFDGMPQSVLSTGIQAETGRPDELALAVARLTRDGVALPPQLLEVEEALLQRLFAALEDRHGVDFSVYKKATMHRRIARRSQRANCADLEAYVDYATAHPVEIDRLQDDLLINVTQFRRDPEAFARLEAAVLPKIVGTPSDTGPIRVWAPGSATGEEAYSLAIAILENMRKRGVDRKLRIFATDVHEGAIAQAAIGIFSASALEPLFSDVRERYFSKVEGGYQVRRALRDRVVFARHDLLNQPPFTQLDLVCCRNLMIYFEPVAQRRVLELFHFSLKKGGFLFLGPSESIADFKEDFEVLDARWRIWTKHRASLSRSQRSPRLSQVTWGGAHSPPLATRSERSSTGEIYESVLESLLPPAVLVSPRSDVLHVFSGAERYLTLRGGPTTTSLLQLLEPRLQSTVASALRHAARAGEEVQYREPIQVSAASPGEDETAEPVPSSGGLTISARPVGTGTGGPDGFLIQFLEPGTGDAGLGRARLNSHGSDDRGNQIRDLENDLLRTQENLQATVEELETSNEELQAANEELVASNEELQSTNEELQSVNEELFTVNDEREKKIEQVSREKADMDNLLQGTEVGVIFLDGDLRIRRFTPKVAEVFQLMEHDIGRSISTFVHPLGIQDLTERIETVLESRAPHESRVTDREGRTFLLRLIPYTLGSVVHGVVLTLVDVTILRAAEDRVEELSFVVENAAEAQAIFSRDGRVTYRNRSFALAFLESAEDDGQECSFTDVFQDWSREDYRELFASCEAEGDQTIETNATLNSGETIEAELRLSHTVFQGRELLYAHAIDVTEKKATERELRLRDRAMAASTNGIVIADAATPSREIVYVNSGFERMTGYTAAESVGRNCRFLQGPETSEESTAQIRAALRDQRPTSLTILNYRKSGESFWNELQITPIKDESDHVTHFVAVQHDITDRIETQRDLLDARQKALAASKAKSRFLANMSHEIRSPMTAILGFADALARRTDDPEMLDSLGTIQRNAEYLLQLIGDILDISKIEANKVTVKPKEVELPGLFAGVVELMTIRASQRSLDFTVDLRTPLPSVACTDPTRVRQVLVNLLANAIKFTPRGSVDLALSFSADTDGPRLTMEVSDTGIGINADELDAIFKPFARPHAHADALSAEFEGSGLGLAIVKRLLSRLGGSISVQSRVGKGSCFTVVIPLGVEDDVAMVDELPQLAAAAPRSQPEGQALLGRTILVADDRADVAKVVRFYLEDAGASVTTVENGALAIDALFQASDASDAFDVVLLDMQMPVMDGYDAARQMRRRGYEGPIIALTAGAMKENEGRCLDAGCSAFLTKPAEEADLIRLVAAEAERPRS